MLNALVFLRCVALLVVLALTPQVYAQSMAQNKAKLIQAAKDGKSSEVKALLDKGALCLLTQVRLACC